VLAWSNWMPKVPDASTRSPSMMSPGEFDTLITAVVPGSPQKGGENTSGCPFGSAPPGSFR
jgi:hypothetical protein